jgi:SAM-dependent methyltransferase
VAQRLEATSGGPGERYWDANPDVGYQDSWTGNPTVAQAVYRRMSGGSGKHWLSWLLEDYFAGRRFPRVLSPGCGTGAHEVIVAASGKADEIDAFDFSEVCLERARGEARSKGLTINFYRDDLDGFVLAPGRSYDLVLCSGTVHHVRELERFYGTIAAALAPGGCFVVNEYVGDCYLIYRARQVALVNRLLACLPRALRSSDEVRLAVQTVEERLAVDPTEAVRSKLVLPFLRSYFDVELERPFGGGLLHPMYPLLNDAFFRSGDPAGEAVLRLLLELEAIFMEEGVLESDFALCVARPRGTLARGALA